MDAAICETVSAPTNIAVIKYWGKKSVALNTPINSSVSVTLNQDDLKAVTTVAASTEWTEDRLWLNGTEEDIRGSKRVQTCLREVRRLARDRVVGGRVVVRKEDWPKYGVRIASANSFPTAAGLASSAAGYAALVAALAKLFCVEEEYPGQLTAIARQGSGSACRSLYGGFVEWTMGAREDGADSIGRVIADEKHWPELRALICVVSSAKKDTSSTTGMSTSVKTSPLLGYRAAALVEPRLAEINAAYRARDFETFGRITMQDSNQFHATCLDTYPPIFYMNDVSKSIIRVVHAINAHAGRVRAAYTFDAGPNAVIYALADDLLDVLAALLIYYPAVGAAYVSDPAMNAAARRRSLPADLLEMLERTGRTPRAGDVKKIYVTTAGDGPRSLPAAECVLDAEGNPKVDYKPKMKTSEPS
eukprot:CAMPEP_0118874672 /NCGR_PEP_ID=MMETSP1163-20130328/16020_1 /TAXON_ID=124430 /ORGANISM="Phaeomonas parva, Strain CCMP2877" /LENGTH=417 /DNA_ID=CAMNT_0006810081 /DNA_START=211 /DNA_END=1460 /DNA_ORIENTATION=-